MSGYRGDHIYYEKVMFSCRGRLVNVFAITYPVAKRSLFDPVVERMEDTFRGTCLHLLKPTLAWLDSLSAVMLPIPHSGGGRDRPGAGDQRADRLLGIPTPSEAGGGHCGLLGGFYQFTLAR